MTTTTDTNCSINNQIQNQNYNINNHNPNIPVQTKNRSTTEMNQSSVTGTGTTTDIASPSTFLDLELTAFSTPFSTLQTQMGFPNFDPYKLGLSMNNNHNNININNNHNNHRSNNRTEINKPFNIDLNFESTPRTPHTTFPTQLNNNDIDIDIINDDLIIDSHNNNNNNNTLNNQQSKRSLFKEKLSDINIQMPSVSVCVPLSFFEFILLMFVSSVREMRYLFDFFFF